MIITAEKTNGYLNKCEIMEVIISLSHSQGLYCRIRESIEEMSEEDRDRFLDHLQAQHFKDSVDLVLYFEC